MAFENTFKRRGRSRRQSREFNPQVQNNILGVNYSASPTTLPANMSPYAQNADFGRPIGAITKVPGYEALITTTIEKTSQGGT
jgi:hypothetical protein